MSHSNRNKQLKSSEELPGVHHCGQQLYNLVHSAWVSTWKALR